MSDYWIFISVPYTDYNLGEICEILKGKESTNWAIGKKTRHRKSLSKGGKVIFYQGGENGRKFVGSGVLESDLIKDRDKFHDYIVVKSIQLWKKPLDLLSILDKLSFIKNKSRYSAYFQGGITKISEKDYSILTKVGLAQK